MEEAFLTDTAVCDDGTNDTSATGTAAEENNEIALSEVESNDLAEESDAKTPPKVDAETEGFARRAEEDLAILSKQFPSLFPNGLASLRDPGRYGELREVGLSPVEAFLASHPELILGGAGRANNRSHLGSCIPRGASLASGQLGARELEEARELFPSLSDGEIEALYRRVEGRGNRRK